MDVHRELALGANPLTTRLQRIQTLLFAPRVGELETGVAGVNDHRAVEVHDFVVQPCSRLKQDEVGPLNLRTLAPVDARRIGEQSLDLQMASVKTGGQQLVRVPFNNFRRTSSFCLGVRSSGSCGQRT